MAAPASSTSSLLLVLVILIAAALISHSANAWPASSSGGGGGLSAGFYDETCPSAQDVVRRVIQDARVADPRIPASLIRLHFHDCFVNGCDASILLDDDLPSGIHTEKRVPANDNSARGFNVVDDIKCELDKACPGVVSCADILAIAAQVSVDLAGGPRWRVQLGRRDATATNIPSADNLPGFTDTLEDLVAKFDAVGLDHGDLVALQGAHTFGRAQCLFTRENCTAGKADDALENLDPVTPDVFDNNYYASLLRGAGKLPSDQVMISDDDPYAAATTAPFVRRFAGSQKSFFRSFAASMIKMGNISPLTGTDGQIRQNCRRINTYY
uniref:Peroxidase n=1 Tax=Oryza sativa subsp. indica TaxID=39946 RepID=A0A6G9KI54_ORYSI|nr:peroxidase 2 [Oryza sativa Indica Group]